MAHSSSAAVGPELRRRLPAEIFHPARSRLLWLLVHVPVVAVGMTLLAQGIPAWSRPFVALAIGFAFGGLAFVAHEALHGALCRRAHWRKLVGAVGFLPFGISPVLWTIWHNRIHHGNTNCPPLDPDAMPTMEQYATERGARISTDVQSRSRGVLTLLAGFSAQSLAVLLRSRSVGYLNASQFRRATAHAALAFSFWVALGVALGTEVFVWGYLLPLMIANALVMMHIVTNHGLSPINEHNDPLEGSLTVTVPRLFSWYTLDFGFHVEHHLFPGMSNRHARLVRRKLLEVVPQRYRSLPLHQALRAFFRQTRVYASQTTLINPRTGRISGTVGHGLGHRAAASAARRPNFSSVLRAPSH